MAGRIHHKGNVHLAAQRFIVRFAKAHQNQPVHIPHRGENRNFADVGSGFDHQKIAFFVDLMREGVQGRHHEPILQNPSLVLEVVVHNHADDARVVLCQQNSCHIGDVSGSLQFLFDPLYRGSGNFLRLAVDHVGNGCRAKPQSFSKLRCAGIIWDITPFSIKTAFRMARLYYPPQK